MLEKCLNCSHEQKVDKNNTYIDSLGKCTLCEKCESSFDLVDDLTEGLEKLIGKKAYKNHNGLFGGLVGVIEKSNSGITPLHLRLADGTCLGAFPKDLVIVNDK